MSVNYDEYLLNHKDNVIKAYDWLLVNLPEIFTSQEMIDRCEYLCAVHDESKYDEDEYNAYDVYFYGEQNNEKTFNMAWLHHTHKNPHHSQYWVLIHDDADMGEECLEMPDEYIIEMICDWWSFSWNKNNLDEIFDWYTINRENMRLHPITRDKVDDILIKINNKLKELND